VEDETRSDSETVTSTQEREGRKKGGGGKARGVVITREGTAGSRAEQKRF